MPTFRREAPRRAQQAQASPTAGGRPWRRREDEQRRLRRSGLRKTLLCLTAGSFGACWGTADATDGCTEYTEWLASAPVDWTLCLETPTGGSSTDGLRLAPVHIISIFSSLLFSILSFF
ncbi:hypothetical protein TEQG_05401 [Trichophyton equinum CBS 127.97]|uniref:Uncharacterized protein n=1 Tax=Trichophyton equinum (strain ATCC MYA-4606 / CBS 127.97) TaxID=559882 RepID=F2PWX9_TRIEC|nr:hypothetical protein TEQG_05401 [Trichophyton equinum CBS 127.97]